MSVAVLLLVSMAVAAGIVGTDKMLALIGGRKPDTTETTGNTDGKRYGYKVRIFIKTWTY